MLTRTSVAPKAPPCSSHDTGRIAPSFVKNYKWLLTDRISKWLLTDGKYKLLPFEFAIISNFVEKKGDRPSDRCTVTLLI